MALIGQIRGNLMRGMANILAQTVPTSVLARLSGIGEPPQFGTSASMQTLQSAMRTAEYGDTWQLFALYRDIEVNWTHLQCEFGKRVMAVVGQKQSIQPYDKANQDDVQAQEAIEDMIQNCDNWDEGQKHLMKGHLYPVAGLEKVFEPVPESEQFKWRHPVRYRLKELKPINYALFNYRIPYQTAGWQSAANGSGISPEDPRIWNPEDWEPDLRFWSTNNSGMITWDLATCYRPDPERHVIHRGNFMSGLRDNFGGAMRGCSFWWLLTQSGRDWFSTFMSRYGSPFVVAYMDFAQKDLVDTVTKSFASSAKLGAILLPNRVKVELKETMVSGAADGFCKYIELCNREVSKIVVGQEMSTVAQPAGLGSGQADLQGEVRQDIREYDERKISDCDRKQIFEQFLRINGFRGRAPHSVWGGLSKNDMLSYAKTLQTIYSAGLRPTESSLPTMSANLGIDVERIPEAELHPQSNNGNGKDKKQMAGAEKN